MRMIAAKTGHHYTGIGQAGRCQFRDGAISASIKKTLQALNIANGYARHIDVVRVERLTRLLDDELTAFSRRQGSPIEVQECRHGQRATSLILDDIPCNAPAGGGPSSLGSVCPSATRSLSESSGEVSFHEAADNFYIGDGADTGSQTDFSMIDFNQVDMEAKADIENVDGVCKVDGKEPSDATGERMAMIDRREGTVQACQTIVSILPAASMTTMCSSATDVISLAADQVATELAESFSRLRAATASAAAHDECMSLVLPPFAFTDYGEALDGTRAIADPLREARAKCWRFRKPIHDLDRAVYETAEHATDEDEDCGLMYVLPARFQKR